MSFNVLIVDDSDVMRKVIRRVVNLSGLDLGDIFEASNGQEALEAMEDQWVDIVLSDINMPVMNGIDLLQRMQEDETMAGTPVIMVTTEGRSERIDEILGLGARGYITKPFKPEDIRNVISQALGVNLDGDNVEEPEDSDF